MVDDNGRTDVDGLHAIGVVSYTGLHGANRMASNLLPRFGLWLVRCGGYCLESACCSPVLGRHAASMDESQVEIPDELVVIQHNWHELRLLMWDYVDWCAPPAGWSALPCGRITMLPAGAG